MTLKCMIVDDEPLAVKVLEKYAGETPGIEVVATCKDALEALEVLQDKKVDLIFLDINMPGLSGVNMVRSLSSPPMVVFVTAYPEFAVEGFELDALDYLVKPVAFDRFLKAVGKARSFLELKSENPANRTGFLTVKADKKLYKVAWDDILFFQAYGDYVKVITIGKQLVTKERLTFFEELLPTGFLKVHRSYLVNLDKISYLEGNRIRVGETMIPVGQKHKDRLLKEMKL